MRFLAFAFVFLCHTLTLAQQPSNPVATPAEPGVKVSVRDELKQPVPEQDKAEAAAPDPDASEYMLFTENELNEWIDGRINERDKREKEKEASQESAAVSKPYLSMPGKWKKGLEFATKDGALCG